MCEQVCEPVSELVSDLPIDPALLETPAYVYDLARIRHAYHRLRETLPEPSALYYSLKANPHPHVLRCLHELGTRAEVSSPGELAEAVRAGFPPGELLYTGPAKRDGDVAAAVLAGVREFAVDSPHGLRQLDRVAGDHGQTVRCLLRINPRRSVPGVGLAMTGVPSAFGADESWVDARPELFTGLDHVDVTGVHLYLATNVGSEDHLVDQFALAVDVAGRVARRLGTPLRVLDLGGGFGAPYARSGQLPSYPTLRPRLTALLDDGAAGWRSGQPLVAFESGRHLVGTCGYLVVRVLDVKPSHGRQVVVLDAGINHLGGMAGLRRVPAIQPEPLPLARPGRPAAQVETLLAGPLCTPLDTWSRSAVLPEFRPGDLVVVPNVGAYGLSASLALFLGHPLPQEVVVDGAELVDVSRLSVRREPAAVAGPQAPRRTPWMTVS